MTEPDFLDLLLGVWRDDIDSVPFPSFAELLIPQQNTEPRQPDIGGTR